MKKYIYFMKICYGLCNVCIIVNGFDRQFLNGDEYCWIGFGKIMVVIYILRNFLV